MRVLVTVLLLALQSTAEAMRMAINCTNTEDCGDGETCVAGDSVTSIQYCVAGVACGGSTSGNCPSDTTSGQLACIKHENVYKCLSIDRCDEYFGGLLCTASCNVNGVQCNGQGSCSVVSTSSDGAPTFGCTCNDGFSGDKCESGSSSGSKTTSSSASKASSSSSSTDSSISEASSSSTSSSFSSASSSTSTSTSSSVSGSSSTLGSVSGSSSFLSSVNGSLSSSSSSLTAASTEGGSSGSVVADSDSGGTSSAVFIIIGILAACIIVGALMFALYSRKRKREQEAEAGGFGGQPRAASGANAAGESNAFGGTGADTPKSSIVIM